jgi:hypothetical protein
MKRFIICHILLSSGLLGGCITSTLVTGQPGPAIANDEVVIYYIDRPVCNFETIAHIQVNGGFLSLESMLHNMRREAAAIGASGLHVLETGQSEMREFRGTAKAIRCMPV